MLLISGIVFKLQQYQQGERFLGRSPWRPVRVGWTGSGPALGTLPSWSEVHHPERWLARMGSPRPGRPGQPSRSTLRPDPELEGG